MTEPTPAERAASRQPWPGESAEYAAARTALLAEEIALQQRIDALSARRRALPPGPKIARGYRFLDGNGAELGLAELFGAKDTLVTYFWMYGPERARPCPMCTNLLGPLAANAADITQRVALAVLGRSPVERQLAFAQERGWRHLAFYQTVGDQYPLDFGGLDAAKGWEMPVLAVFHKEADGTIRLFWKGAMTPDMADPGTDPRGGVDMAPLWSLLDLTPAGRPADWYPKLVY
jgi:predicted dithiol-disulfide oxidoreductase (DUF899 family)